MTVELNRKQRRAADAELRRLLKRAKRSSPVIQSELRHPGELEVQATDPKTPRQLDQRVVIKCPSGRLNKAEVQLEDGTNIENIISIQLMAENGRNAEGGVFSVFIRRFEPETGAVIHEISTALLG